MATTALLHGFKQYVAYQLLVNHELEIKQTNSHYTKFLLDAVQVLLFHVGNQPRAIDFVPYYLLHASTVLVVGIQKLVMPPLASCVLRTGCFLQR